QADRLAEADEELRVRQVAPGQATGLLLVDALRELHPLLRKRTVRVHRAHGARELAHLQEELHGERLELIAAQLAVGEREPERVAAEGPARLDARDQIANELCRGQNLAHELLRRGSLPCRRLPTADDALCRTVA